MSKLNAGAFEFVPGRAFSGLGPPQTISLNIGSKPAPAPAPANTSPTPSHPASHSSSPAPPVSKKIFSTEKSKSDTTAIAREVQSVADEAVLKDLFGDGQ
jgi:peptide chain release factor subunit 3